MFDERYLSQFPAHRAQLVRAAMRMLSAKAEAEDAVQDTYLRALEVGEPPGLEVAQAWLTTVMQRIAIDRLRRANRLQRWLLDTKAQDQGAAPQAPSAESEVALAEATGQALRLLAARLMPADGAAVMLREIFELSFKEIAQASGKTEAACRQQLHRALLRLREGGPDDDAGAETTFHVYRQALQDCDPTRLLAMLRQPPLRSVALSAVAAPKTDSCAPRALCQVMQIGGRIALVLTLGGKVLCVLPLQAQHSKESACSI